MKIFIQCIAISVFLFSTFAYADQTGASASNKTNISADEAKKIALNQVPSGKVKSSELEKEGGRQVWSFDIVTPAKGEITEVLIDAKNGSVVDKHTETAAQERAEAKSESTRKPH